MNEVRRQCVLAISNRFIDILRAFYRWTSFVRLLLHLIFHIFHLFSHCSSSSLEIDRKLIVNKCNTHTHIHDYDYEYEIISTRFVKLYGHDIEIHIYLYIAREREWGKNDTHVMYTHAYKNTRLFFLRCYGVWCQLNFFFSFLFFAFTIQFPSSFPLADYHLHEYEFCKHFSIFVRRNLLAVCLSIRGNQMEWHL